MNLLEKEELQAAFATSLLLPSGLEPRLHAALGQILGNPGSLVRPQIVLQMSMACQLPREHARALAIALEYFHTASLLFDDLPCMDNAVERRGGLCFWGLSYQIVDDLKDVLQGTAETGKTVSRDRSLDRPNIALAIGVPAAMQRLKRLIDLGDKALGRLLLRKPAVAFLGILRTSLQEEMARVTHGACASTTRGGA
jgi:geranylgeranyl pyrophosphate synthase